MKMVFITDESASRLIEKLELYRLKKKEEFAGNPELCQQIQEIHRKFHYEVCSWMEKEGLHHK